jgi:hypothetical protein
MDRARLFMIWILIVGHGCGATPQEQHAALNVITDVADPTYEIAMEGCDAYRNAIVAREGTTLEEDEAAMAEVDRICDAVVVGFEALRGTQLTARSAIDAGASGVAAEAISAGLGAWMELQELVPQLQELGRTVGGEL